MGVTGNNLLNISKLIFSISQSENNDKLFVEEQMIQPIVRQLAIVDISDALNLADGGCETVSGKEE